MSVEPVALSELSGMLVRTRPFADVSADALGSLSVVDRVKAPAGTTLMEPGKGPLHYWLVLEGECRADRVEADGSLTHGREPRRRAKPSARPHF